MMDELIVVAQYPLALKWCEEALAHADELVNLVGSGELTDTLIAIHASKIAAQIACALSVLKEC